MPFRFGPMELIIVLVVVLIIFGVGRLPEIGGAMGKASNFAMGLALAQPDTKVVCFDGDGSLNMNLGTMMTIAGAKPKNLIHFVLNNGYFSVTGGQPIAAADDANFSQMAAGAGYAASYEFDNIEDFAGKVEEVHFEKLRKEMFA